MMKGLPPPPAPETGRTATRAAAGTAAKIFFALGACSLFLASLLGEGPAITAALSLCPWTALLCLLVAVVFGWPERLAPFRDRLGIWLFDSGNIRFYVGLGLLAATIYSIAALVIYGGVPHLDDSAAALWQARVFASGRIRLPLPENPEFFRIFGVLSANEHLGHQVGMYPPGWSVLMLPGVLLGVAWLATPLLGGALVIAVARVAAELYGERTGRIAGMLALSSPMISGLSATMLSHVPTALFLTLALLAVMRLTASGRLRHGAAAGAAWSAAFLCRPLTALVVGCVLALWPLAHWRAALRAWKAILLALLFAGAGAGTLAAWQEISTGAASVPGHSIGMGRRGRFGFARLDWAREHTPEAGLQFTLNRMKTMNTQLVGWPVPALALALLPFLLGTGRWREAWLLGPWLALLGVYSAFWYWEECYPARYTFCGAPPLLVLAARGLASAEEILCARGPRTRAVARCALIAGMLFALCAALPQNYAYAGTLLKDVELTLPRAVKACGLHNAVVFVSAKGRHPTDDDAFNDFYATGFLMNSLDFSGDLVFARDLGKRNSTLMAAHPGRRFYRYVYFRDSNKAELFELAPAAGGLVQKPIPIPPP